MRLLKVRMLDGAIKSIMVDDSQIVTNMMVIICTKIGITNHDEYSLVREKTEDEENQAPNKKYGTLGTIGGTLTLKRKHKNNDPDEPQIDPKMATLRKNLHTEDGGKIIIFFFSREMAARIRKSVLSLLVLISAPSCGSVRRLPETDPSPGSESSGDEGMVSVVAGADPRNI